jgi:hypothetical protein
MSSKENRPVLQIQRVQPDDIEPPNRSQSAMRADATRVFPAGAATERIKSQFAGGAF